MSPTPKLTPPLRALGLRKRYGQTTVVEDVGLSVRPGEVLGLLGPNGAGKTSLVQLLDRQLDLMGVHLAAELGAELLRRQSPRGTWTNPVDRWMEGDPALVTAYAVLTLEHIHRAL